MERILCYFDEQMRKGKTAKHPEVYRLTCTLGKNVWQGKFDFPRIGQDRRAEEDGSYP
jgi:hypothetical protein